MVQWYPGHMAKAKREVQEKLKLVDIVFELIDSRIPLSSKNPMIDEIIKNKPSLIIMTKADKADPIMNNKWILKFKQEKKQVLLIDSISGFNVNKIVTLSKEILKEKIEKDSKKGLKERPIRCMIVGIPNVGKSTLINKLVNKKVTITGDKPGVTKAQQWIRINKDLELLDTPGVLWPKFDSIEVGYKLFITGAIKDEIVHKDDIIKYLLEFLLNNYPKVVNDKYNIIPGDEFVDCLDKIGKARGYLVNGEVDYEKVYLSILNDFRSNRLGKVTLDLI